MSHTRPGLEGEAQAAAELGRLAWWVIRSDFSSVWSPGMCKLFGLPDDATSEAIVERYHPDDRNYVTRGIVRLFETGVVSHTRYRIVRPDGEVRHVFSRAVRREGAGGPELFGVNIDVTEHMADAQDEMAQTRRHRFIAENARDLIVRYRPDGVLTFVSPASRSLLGFAPEEMVGRTVLSFLDPESHPNAAANLQARSASGQAPSRMELRVRRRDGGGVWLEGNPRPALNTFRQVIEWVDVLRDVSERKAAEEALVEARRAADAAAEAKSEFLANMSHELRTPLTSIIGFADLIGRAHSLGPKDDARLAHIRRASRALLAVVNDVLEVSRLEQGAVDLEAEPFDLATLVNDAAALLTPQAEDKGVRLTIACAGPAGPLLGDAARLSQILLNLLSNAVKFTERGGEIRVEAGCTTGEDGREAVRLSVRDTGIGIAADRLDALFERFTQADGSISRRYGGAGLGLAISRRLADLMGGRLTVESRPGAGSCFALELSLPRAPDAPTLGGGGADATLPDRPLRVLLAEDHPANRELVRAILSAWPIELETAVDGSEALSRAVEGRYDLVLMDVQMPVMDGVAATRAIRALSGAARDVPIVALSANVLPDQVARYRAAGFDDHVAKPIIPAQLFAAIGRAMRPRTATEAAA